MYRHIANMVHLGSNNDQCYIQNRVVTNRVIERSRCIIYLFIYIANTSLIKFLCMFSSLNHESGIWFQL